MHYKVEFEILNPDFFFQVLRDLVFFDGKLDVCQFMLLQRFHGLNTTTLYKGLSIYTI